MIVAAAVSFIALSYLTTITNAVPISSPEPFFKLPGLPDLNPFDGSGSDSDGDDRILGVLPGVPSPPGIPDAPDLPDLPDAPDLPDLPGINFGGDGDEHNHDHGDVIINHHHDNRVINPAPVSGLQRTEGTLVADREDSHRHRHNHDLNHDRSERHRHRHDEWRTERNEDDGVRERNRSYQPMAYSKTEYEREEEYSRESRYTPASHKEESWRYPKPEIPKIPVRPDDDDCDEDERKKRKEEKGKDYEVLHV